MMIRWLLAAVHLSAFGFALVGIAGRNRALRRVAAAVPPARDELAAVFRSDAMWGLAALVLIVTGLVRAFGGVEKGAAYYLHEPLFHLKMGALLLILLLELRPMLGLVRWRLALRAQTPPELGAARVYARIGHLQAVLMIVMVFAASGMARGIGFAG
jgi:putative membrane protein